MFLQALVENDAKKQNKKNKEITPDTVTVNLSPEASAKPVQETARQEKYVPIVAVEGNPGTVTINLSPEDSAKLFEKAANQGKDVSILAYELLAKILDGEAEDQAKFLRIIIIAIFGLCMFLAIALTRKPKCDRPNSKTNIILNPSHHLLQVHQDKSDR